MHVAHGLGCTAHIIWPHKESRHAVHDHLTETAAVERHYRRPARLGFGSHHAEWFVPLRWTQHYARVGKRRPQQRPGYAWVHCYPRQCAARVHLCFGVIVVVAIAVDIDWDPRRERYVDGLGDSLFRAEPAGENGADAVRGRR